jgi:hypothetical protein
MEDRHTIITALNPATAQQAAAALDAAEHPEAAAQGSDDAAANGREQQHAAVTHDGVGRCYAAIFDGHNGAGAAETAGMINPCAFFLILRSNSDMPCCCSSAHKILGRPLCAQQMLGACVQSADCMVQCELTSPALRALCMALDLLSSPWTACIPYVLLCHKLYISAANPTIRACWCPAARKLHLLLASHPALRLYRGETGPPAVVKQEEAAVGSALKQAFRQVGLQIWVLGRAMQGLHAISKCCGAMHAGIVGVVWGVFCTTRWKCMQL